MSFDVSLMRPDNTRSGIVMIGSPTDSAALGRDTGTSDTSRLLIALSVAFLVTLLIRTAWIADDAGIDRDCLNREAGVTNPDEALGQHGVSFRYPGLSVGAAAAPGQESRDGLRHRERRLAPEDPGPRGSSDGVVVHLGMTTRLRPTASRKLVRIQTEVRKCVEKELKKHHGWSDGEVKKYLADAAKKLGVNLEKMLALLVLVALMQDFIG